MHNGTNETTPWHIWLHEVTMAAVAKGGNAETAREDDMLKRLQLWYRSGESVWMAADSLAFVSKQRVKIAREDAEVNGLRRAIRRGLGKQS